MEENHYNCIYMYTNKINGKRYVGKAEDFLIRKQRHIYGSYNKKNKRDYNTPFHRAIRKYGIESFDATILKENLTKDEMNYWEDYYIETFDSYANHGKGYNVAKGGTGGNTIEGKTEEEKREYKQKLSESHKGEKFSEEHKQKISQANSGENNPMYGKHHSESTKQKISEIRKEKQLAKGKNNPNAKKVAQCDKQGNLIKIWDYAKQASEELGINRGNICSCCKGKLKSAGGYIWRYAEQTE